jgi:hypothetical protein
MPSSHVISPMGQAQRRTFNPKDGRILPYSPFPNPYQAKVMQISKIRHPNPFLINRTHFSKT